jgi:hypothetical protein
MKFLIFAALFATFALCSESDPCAGLVCPEHGNQSFFFYYFFLIGDWLIKRDKKKKGPEEKKKKKKKLRT